MVAVAREQRAALATGMPRRQVTVVEDETFHPHICLVGLEPVSNFILLEQYAQDRTAATWTAALQAALTGLAVEVIQGISDEVKALRRHVAVDWDAHHSPDLFHGQQEIAKATRLPLARAVAQATATWTAAQARGAAVETAAPPPPLDDRWPTASKPHQAALTDLAQAQVAHAAALTVLLPPSASSDVPPNRCSNKSSPRYHCRRDPRADDLARPRCPTSCQ